MKKNSGKKFLLGNSSFWSSIHNKKQQICWNRICIPWKNSWNQILYFLIMMLDYHLLKLSSPRRKEKHFSQITSSQTQICLMLISRAMKIFTQLIWLSSKSFLSCSNSQIFPYQRFHIKTPHPKNQFPSISRSLPDKNSDFQNHILFERKRGDLMNDPKALALWWLFNEVQWSKIFC